MDVKRYINTRIWSDTWFEELDGIERLIWLYLLTNQQTNLIWIYEIGMRRISNESGVEINRLQTVMKRFKNDLKSFHNGRFVIIPNYLKNQNLANPNMEKSASNLFEALPSDVKNVLQSIGINDFEILKNGLPNGFQTVSKPFPNPSIREREIEREIEREEEEVSQNSDFAQAPIGFHSFGFPEEVRLMAPDGLLSTKPKPSPLPEAEKKKKVAPKKKSQLEIMEMVAFPFGSIQFRNLWKIWLEHRARIKKTYDEVSMQAALKKLSNYDEQVVIWAIEDSLANGWQGLFPEKPEYEKQLRKNQQHGSRENPAAQFDTISRKVQEKFGRG